MIKTSKDHLANVDESYFEHQGVAFRYAYKCFKAALMAFIHGFVPGWFQTSASELVSSLAKSRKED